MERKVPPAQRRIAEYWPPTGSCQLRALECKQRGLYSDDITNPRVKIILDDKIQLSTSRFRESISPYIAPVKVDFCKVTDYFSSGGDTPKVQIPYKSLPGSVPRRIAVERLRRQYMKTDIEQLLSDQGIDIDQLKPKCFGEQMNSSINGLSPYLPLEIFDNEDFDCRTPEDWLALGKPAGSVGRKPVPAKALLFEDDSSDASSMHRWHLVGVLDYSEETRRYLVEKVVLNGKPQNEASDHWSDRTKRRQGVSTAVTCGKHWVPRIRLLFCAEDPHVFAQRLQFALSCREDSEALILYHLYVDCMPVCESLPSIDTLTLRRIMKNALSAPGFTPKTLETRVQALEEEVKLQHARAMNGMVFDTVVRSSPEMFSYVKLPREYLPPNGTSHTACINSARFQANRHSNAAFEGPAAVVPLLAYSENKKSFFKKSLLNNLEVIKVLSKVQSECNKVANMKLFNVSFNKPIGLEEFRGNQSQIHTQTSLFLHESWVPTLGDSVRCNFGNNVKGPYNLKESCWEMYNTSKLHRFMSLVRYHMQDALRYLVHSSLVNLGHVIVDACSSVLTCPADMVWGDNLITSRFNPKNHPLFHVDLVLAQSGAHYSPPVEEFQTALTQLFDEAILCTHNVPRLEKFVMPHLFFGGDPVISSVRLWEPDVVELREKISGALSKAAVVLKAYAAEYSQFIDLHNSDINGGLESPVEGCQTSQEVRKEVERHLKEKDRLEQLLPASLVIGPFLIRVEAVRQALFNKTKALSKATLKHFASILRNQVDDVSEQCDVVHKKLHKKPDSVEELTEQRIWMEQLPDRLENDKETLVKILSEYELFYEFCHTIPKQDVNKRFTAMVWPLKISKDIKAVAAQHVELECHFLKILRSDQNNFEDHLDSLQEQVAGLEHLVDLDHAHDVVNKVRRTGKLLQECQAMAETYNNRERLLGLAVTSYDRVEAMKKDFQPFWALWTTTYDWLYWHKVWLSDPLTSVEPETLERNVAQALQTMAGCVEHFKETPGCQVVATEIHGKIKDFAKYIPLIQGLRHSGMRRRHWEMLAQQTEIVLIPVVDLTFSRCLELGLQNHGDAVAQVVEIAEMEFAVEQSLEKMQHTWSAVHLDVMPHQESGSYRVQVSEEVFSLLESHLATTQNMSTSPFKQVFDDRIRSWELQLKLTKEVLLECLACQSSWVCLQSVLSSDAINRMIPEEAKIHKRVDRVCRGIMKSAFDNSKVMDWCSEDCLLDELKFCNTVLKDLTQKLEDRADGGLTHDSTKYGGAQDHKEPEEGRQRTAHRPVQPYKILSKESAIVLTSNSVNELLLKASDADEKELEAAKKGQLVKDEKKKVAERVKLQMIEQDLLAEQNEQIQREREDRKKAQLMLERVTALKLEQENEIRSLNNKISLALCHAACETQVAEKKKFEELEEEESKRLDAKVQMERQKVYDKRDQMEEDIRHQRIRGRQEICRQIEEHERERMVLRQLREKEMQDIRDRHAQMIQEDIEAAEARREEQRRLIEEVIRINTEAVRIKNEKREKERQDDMRNMEYTINKLDRDARYEAEQKKKKRDKEMELAKLWALQKKAGDHQAEMDAHHAWRHGEIVDGEWRKKQRELALKRAKQEERHQAEIAEQHKFKTHMKALQADKEKREFERLLKEQEHKINKEKIEIEKKRQQLQQHNEAVKLQQDAFRRQEIANRKEKFEEAMRRNEEHDRENRRIAEFKAKKLSDLEKIGLPKKYCSAMQRRAGVMTAGDQ